MVRTLQYASQPSIMNEFMMAVGWMPLVTAVTAVTLQSSRGQSNAGEIIRENRSIFLSANLLRVQVHIKII